MISSALNFGDRSSGGVDAENGAAARSAATVPEPADTVMAALSAQIETISDRIRRALECPVCLQVATNMMCFCPNGHVVCEPCLARLWSNTVHNHCPMCRSLLMPTSDTSATADKLSEVFNLVRVTCTNRRFGCAELPIVRALDEHETACPYKPNLQCHVSVCQWTGVYDQLLDHVRQMHSGDVLVDQSVT